MRHLYRCLALAALTLAPLASAQPNRKPIKQAVAALDDAASRARRSNPQCKATVYNAADQLSDQVDALKREGASARDAGKLKFDIANLSSSATWAGCSDDVVQALHRASDLLDEARVAMWNDRRDDRRDDRREDRRDDQNSQGDDNDNRWDIASMQPLQVQTNGTFEREPAVRVQVPELTLRTMQGKTFYMAARFKSFQGNWSEWITTQQWQVPSDPFIWKNAFTHYFRYSTLAEEDFSNGSFVARVSLFDANGRELAFREATFKVRLPQLPPAPITPVPIMPSTPALPIAVQQPMAPADCGTGRDLGCAMMRDGRYPMDAATYQGFMRALQSNTNEMMRAQTVQSMFTNNYVTALQFGMILDLFQNENAKMSVAQNGAPRVVNPQHALGYAEKFASNQYRAGYTQLMAQQQAGGQAQPMQPIGQPYRPMGQPMPPPPPVQQQQRDCGTGPQDPGCMMQRNGRWALDAIAWAGIYNSLRAQFNEITRQQMLESSVGNQGVTAAQLGLLMDLFQNEITRLDVAKFLAPRVVNPQHAYGYSTKFRNSILANDFVTVMGQQR